MSATLRWLGPVAIFFAPGLALACGGSGPGGTGACPFPKDKRVVRLGASFGTTWSRISFGDSREPAAGGSRTFERKADTRRSVAYATVATSLSRKVLLEVGLGGLMPNGYLDGATRAELGPGAALAVTFAWRVLEAEGARPFVTLTGTLSGLVAQSKLATTQHVPYAAMDARVGVNVGFALWKQLRPYVVGRVFGGPIFWKYVEADGRGEKVTGTDVYKYQAGGGLSWALPHHLDVFVEGIGVGEKGLFAGAGVAL